MAKDLQKKYDYAWDKYSKDDFKALFKISDEYKAFMSKCKTERECTREFIKRAEVKGYKNIEELLRLFYNEGGSSPRKDPSISLIFSSKP